MTPLRSLAAAVALALAIGVPAPAWAQQTDDEDLDDQARRDQEYLERYSKKPAVAEEAPADDVAEVERLLARADGLIRDKNYRSTQSERYRIQTDDPRLDLGAISGLLEGFAAFFDGQWPGEPPPPSEPSRVFLFYSYHKYNQVLEGDWRREVVRPAGHYGSALDAIVIHSDSEGAKSLAGILLHEAAHQLVDRRLYSGDARPSMWVSEGLATCFENTFMSDAGEFEPGVVGPQKVALVRGGKPDAGSDARARLGRVRQALADHRDSETSLASRIVEADEPSEFYGPGVLERYDLSWVLVHYLLYGEQGRRRDGFVRFLALDATGRGDAQALERETGVELGRLDGALLEHLKSIKPRS